MASPSTANSRTIQFFRLLLGFLILATCTIAQEDDDLNKPDVTNSGINQDLLAVDVRCHTESMCVHLDKQWLRQQWGVDNLQQLSLRERCDLSAAETEAKFILCTSEGKLMSCGNEFAQNDTHVTFSNFIHILFLSSATRLIPSVKASLPWECTYPLKLLVGVQYIPQISPVTVFLGNKSGIGEFEAAMFLYKDDEFLHAYGSTPVLHHKDKLRVKVQLLRGPVDSRLQVVKCWGTPVPVTKEGRLTYTLIDDYCPSAEAARADVKLMNNGDLQHALWESKVFRFVIKPEVYIHCHVKVCFGGTDCEKKCLTTNDVMERKRRGIRDSESGLISLGPLSIGLDVPKLSESVDEPLTSENKEQPASSTNDEDSTILGMPRTVLYAMIGSLAALCLILVLAVSVGLRLKANERKQKTERYWKQQIGSRNRLSKRFTLSNGPPFEIPISVPNTLASTERRSSELPK